MKRRLLLVIEAIQMNGAVTGWLGYLSAIDRNEWDIDVFLFDPDQHDGLALPQDVRILPADPHCVIERVGLWAALGYALKRGRIDLAVKRFVFSILQGRFARFRKWNLMRPAKMQPQHYDVAIASAQGISWEYVMEKVSADKKFLWVDTDVRAGYWRFVWEYFKRYVPASAGVVCVSKAMRDQMRKDNPQWAEKIFAMNYVIDVDAILKKSEAPCLFEKTSRMRFVTVGRYSPEKGQQLIPAIAEQVKRAGVDFEWYVIAPGSSAHKEIIDREIHDRGVAENVVVMEGMKNPFPMVKSADISVQPSFFEGFGLTVSEAIILGTYVVASDIPSFREQIVSSDLGLFAPIGDVDAFAVAIREAAARIREGGVCNCYESPYSAENIYREFLGIVNISIK